MLLVGWRWSNGAWMVYFWCAVDRQAGRMRSTHLQPAHAYLANPGWIRFPYDLSAASGRRTAAAGDVAAAAEPADGPPNLPALAPAPVAASLSSSSSTDGKRSDPPAVVAAEPPADLSHLCCRLAAYPAEWLADGERPPVRLVLAHLAGKVSVPLDPRSGQPVSLAPGPFYLCRSPASAMRLAGTVTQRTLGVQFQPAAEICHTADIDRSGPLRDRCSPSRLAWAYLLSLQDALFAYLCEARDQLHNQLTAGSGRQVEGDDPLVDGLLARLEHLARSLEPPAAAPDTGMCAARACTCLPFA